MLLYNRHAIFRNGSLLIRSVDVNDVGFYRCIGSGQTFATELRLACKLRILWEYCGLLRFSISGQFSKKNRQLHIHKDHIVILGVGSNFGALPPFLVHADGAINTIAVWQFKKLRVVFMVWEIKTSVTFLWKYLIKNVELV